MFLTGAVADLLRFFADYVIFILQSYMH